jgi:hypothetical protein
LWFRASARGFDLGVTIPVKRGEWRFVLIQNKSGYWW